MDTQYQNFQRRVTQYREILQNTDKYRKIWIDSLKNDIIENVEKACEAVGLEIEIEERLELENLEAVVVSLGNVKSGVTQEVAANVHRDLVKHNGALVYQQLFNGKILVLINFPYLENYGQPQPPKTIAIYRPEELNANTYLRHLESFIQEITMWEDFDDDNHPAQNSQNIGFRLNFGAVEKELNEEKPMAKGQ